MKKLSLLLLAAVIGATEVLAQQESQQEQQKVIKIKTTDGRVVRYATNEVEEILFVTLFHDFDGYITASTSYFEDNYFGGMAKLSVWKSVDGYDVTLSDPIWGDAEFTNVSMERGQLGGEGTITVSAQYGGGTFEAAISGSMSSPIVTIPNLMRGTTLTYHLGTPPISLSVKGSHQGSVSVMVGGQGNQFGPYINENITYSITTNEDGSINIVVPEFTLDETQIGNLTLGTYTISNITYDEEKGAFFRDYTTDNLSFHFKAEKDGSVTMDNDYAFTQLGNIEIKKTETGLTIVNSFQPGRMPFPITSTFEKAQGHAR